MTSVYIKKRANDMPVGSELEGVYLGSRGTKSRQSHIIETTEGVVKLFGATVLNRKLELVQIGEPITILCEKEKLTQDKKHKYKFYQVFRSHTVSIANLKKHLNWYSVSAPYEDRFQIIHKYDRNYFVGTCPKCGKEKTLYMYEDHANFKCHACGVGGDILNWLELFHPTPIDALREMYVESKALGQSLGRDQKLPFNEPRGSTGHIYMVQIGNNIKVGCATHFKQRLKTYKGIGGTTFQVWKVDHMKSREYEILQALTALQPPAFGKECFALPASQVKNTIESVIASHENMLRHVMSDNIQTAL